MTGHNDECGYIYILENEWMPGLIKIGKTGNILKRINDLSNTSVPVAFRPVHVSKVKKENMNKIEDTLHKVFSKDRVNPKREFFQMDEDMAIRILGLVELENVTDEVIALMRRSLEPAEIKALDESEERIRSKRPRLNFHILGIKNDEHLYWKDDETKFVTICSENKVVFNGVVCSLTAATKQILNTDTPVAPSPYWRYNGVMLSDIYNEYYTPTDSEE